MIDKIIDGGHPQDHVVDWEGADVDPPDGKIEGETEEEILGQLIGDVMDAGEDAGDVKNLDRDRKAWFDRETGHVVIYDPNGPGTGFVPDDPEDFWNGLK